MVKGNDAELARGVGVDVEGGRSAHPIQHQIRITIARAAKIFE